MKYTIYIYVYEKIYTRETEKKDKPNFGRRERERERRIGHKSDDALWLIEE